MRMMLPTYRARLYSALAVAIVAGLALVASGLLKQQFPPMQALSAAAPSATPLPQRTAPPATTSPQPAARAATPPPPAQAALPPVTTRSALPTSGTVSPTAQQSPATTTSLPTAGTTASPTAHHPPQPPTTTSPAQPSATGATAEPQPTRGTAAPTTAPTHAPVPRPAIVSRAEWGAAKPVATFIPQQPQQITLHHEGVFFDGSIPAAQYLRRVQHWSMHTKKWPDIPYHFLIDLAGTIYEGRPLTARGDTNTAYDPQGHALVALLGKYDAGEQEPNAAQINATIALMAWIADQYQIAPDTIHGHRDFIPSNARGEHIDPRTGSRITCPGDNLYRYLSDGTIQRGVAEILAR